jgi:large subunit ribosomal protein L3
MQAGLFAKKIGMTQIFDESGTIFPVTILKVGLCRVSQIKTVISDGYNAVQVAYGKQNLKKLNRPTLGKLKKSGFDGTDLELPSNYGYSSFGEFQVLDSKNLHNKVLESTLTVGEIIKADIFVVGQKVRVTGKSIGKGFASNQKRHNFSRGPMTHGSKNHRLPGSIGAGSTPGRVYPGKKMSGQLGGEKVTLKNLEVIYVSSEDNVLVLKGSVPGKKNSILKIQSQ